MLGKTTSIIGTKETEIVYNYNQGNLQQNITDTFTYTATNKARLFVDCLAGAHGAELDGCSNVSDGTLNGTVVTPLYTFDDSPQYGSHHCKIFEVSMEIGDVFQVSVTSNWSSNSKVNGRVYAHILAIREIYKFNLTK